jgi:Mg-chelatase subunit ChlD
MAVAALRDILEAFDAEGLPDPEQLDIRVRTDIERLVALQNDNGGWPWFQKGRESIPFQSIQATHALVLAQAADYPVPQATIDRGLEHLAAIEEYFPSEYSEELRNTLSAYALYVRNEAGGGDTAKATALYERVGDDLDLDALVSRVADVRAGATVEADQRVYLGLRRLARSFGVLLLVDVSGSTADPAPSGETVLAVQVDAASRLIRAFSSLGVSVAAYAFRSRGRHAVRLERLLSFFEHSPTAGIARTRQIQGEGFTRLGAAVRHASTVLFDEAGTRERLLLVISDGFAFVVDYEGEYAETDARRALEEARTRGVACLCLSFGTSESDAALSRVFGSAAHVSAGALSEILDRLPVLLRHALAEGRGRRRVA